jgi:hypothetical protein
LEMLYQEKLRWDDEWRRFKNTTNKNEN